MERARGTSDLMEMAWTGCHLHSHTPCTAERRLAQPDNAIAFVLTVPDAKQCKQTFLTAARALTFACFVAYTVCVGG